MTRTVHVGRVSPAARQIYQAVLESQQAAIAAVRPGATTGVGPGSPASVPPASVPPASVPFVIEVRPPSTLAMENADTVGFALSW